MNTSAATLTAGELDAPVPRRRAVVSARPRRRWFAVHGTIPWWSELLLGVASWAGMIALWSAIVLVGWANPKLLPMPHEVVTAWWELVRENSFLSDVWVSVLRIAGSFALAAAIAVPLGVLMGAFRGVEAFFNPLVSPARYLPAPAFAPLLLMWLGTGNGQKVALLVLGVIWFLVTLVMDQVKTTTRELMEAAQTLGAGRREVLLRVALPEALPGIVTALRQMLAVSWTYLIIAEIVAATDGIGAVMMRARRFVRTDEVMAGILTIGLLGLLFDLLFRLFHRRVFPCLYRR